MGWQEFFKGLFKADINAKVADTVQTGDGDTFKDCIVISVLEETMSIEKNIIDDNNVITAELTFSKQQED